MKKIIFALLWAMVALPGIAHDFYYTYEGHTLRYQVSESEEGVCRVVGTKDNVSDALIIPTIAKDGEKEYSVTLIDSYAFTNATNITSVTIPESITYIGNNAFNGCAKLKEIFFNAENCQNCGMFSGPAFPPTVQKVTFGDNVKTIPDDAFFGCAGLTSITIPKSVTSIGYKTFDECTGITEVIFNAENCGKCGAAFTETLQKVTFGDNVKTIPSYPFSKCTGLSSLTIPESVKKINYDAFKKCTGLEEVIFNAENCEICEHPFPATLPKLTIGEEVKTIPEGAFSECQNLTTVTIPASVTTIGNSAFSDCVSLTEVNTPSIENWVNIIFMDNYSNPICYAKKLVVNGNTVEELTIPEGVSKINAYAFYNCQSLTTVSLPTTLTAMGNYAFDQCCNLQRDIFPDIVTYLALNYDTSNAKITYGNNSKVYIGAEEFDQENIDWPASLTKIPDYVFCDNKSLMHITIPETVTEIGRVAFYGCSKLSEIVIPPCVSEIKDYTFYGCSNLGTIVIPNSVTEIGACTFAQSGLKSVTIPASVDTIGEYAFYECRSLDRADFNSIESLCACRFANEYSNPFYVARNDYISGEKVEEIVIPATITSIGDFAFVGCNELAKVTIPNSVKTIGRYAFALCYNNVYDVYYGSQDPISGDSNIFSNNAYWHGTLYVPAEAIEKCKTIDPWRKFNNIEAFDFPDGIEDVTNDFDTGKPYEVYNLNGEFVDNSTDGLSPGFYIARQGNAVRKIFHKTLD